MALCHMWIAGKVHAIPVVVWDLGNTCQACHCLSGAGWGAVAFLSLLCPFKWLFNKPVWRRKWQPTPVLLPVKFHGQRNLAVYTPGGHKESVGRD